MQPNPHECPAKTSRLAIASLVCGLLGFFCFPALAGIILGIAALVKIGKSGGQLKGNGLAIAGISLSCVMLLIVMPAAFLMPCINTATGKAQCINCLNNMRSIGVATRLYAHDHDGMYPTNFQSIGDEIGNPKILWCPADKKHTPALDWSTFNPNKNLSYEYMKPGIAESNAMDQIIIRCSVHDNVLLGDGSVQTLKSKKQGESSR